MPETAKLSDLPVGSTLLLPCRLTARGTGGVTLDVLAPGGGGATVTGQVQIARPSGTVTGAWTSDPADQPVRVVAYALQVGNVVRNRETGEVLVVQAVGLGPTADRWSSATSGSPSYSADGWMVIGSATIP
ncbi:MAG TPA: hypothetical protein VG276_27845 [Actinomycetes bacterium]|jgi:hypothetical protein|nr:hypothetical protein [Actinomycetes bacterium]